MNSEKIKIVTRKPRKDDFKITGIPAGLAKSHKIIRTEKIRELQFLKLCAQIELNENRQKRSESQRSDRFEKRIYH